MKLNLILILILINIVNSIKINNNENNNNNKIKFVENSSSNEFDDSNIIGIWPHPYEVARGDIELFISSTFKFTSNLTTSTNLNNSISRYYNLIFNDEPNNFNSNNIMLEELEIFVNSNDETLQLGFDESYSLVIKENENKGRLVGGTIYGVMRGLETFYQMVVYNYKKESYSIPNCPWIINDKPRFQHRGLMLDTSRHFYNVDVILELLDAMSYNKLNTFHWHAVDAQSFPLTSVTYPNITNGAWSPREIYSTYDIKRIIQHAKERGIRVELEIDMPGHAYSWGVGYPGVLPSNYNESPECNAICPFTCNVPLDPSSQESYDMANGLLEEFTQESMFNESFFHIGGDEVSYPCWNSSDSIKKWMIQQNFTFQQASQYFEQSAIDKLISLNRNPVMWEDAYFLFGDSLPKEVVVQVYHNQALAANTTRDGYKTIQSSYWPWYLDNTSTASVWQLLYSIDPAASLPLNSTNNNLFLGAEMCMWSELVDTSNLFTKIFPRASAGAERFWSPSNIIDIKSAELRLEKFRCSLLERSIGSAPLNSTSPVDPDSCYLS